LSVDGGEFQVPHIISIFCS